MQLHTPLIHVSNKRILINFPSAVVSGVPTRHRNASRATATEVAFVTSKWAWCLLSAPKPLFSAFSYYNCAVGGPSPELCCTATVSSYIPHARSQAVSLYPLWVDRLGLKIGIWESAMGRTWIIDTSSSSKVTDSFTPSSQHQRPLYNNWKASFSFAGSVCPSVWSCCWIGF